MGLFTAITWKYRRHRFGPLRWTTRGPQLVSAHADLWLWKGQFYPRKARR